MYYLYQKRIERLVSAFDNKNIPTNFSSIYFWNNNKELDLYYYIKLKFNNIHEGVYRILNLDFEEKLCLNEKCNNKVNFGRNYQIGFKKFCCNKCVSSSNFIKNKKENTMLKKYGVSNPSYLNSAKEKRKNTMLKNYGVEYYTQHKDFKFKYENTMLKNYGVIHNFKIKDFYKTVKETCIKKYGVDNPSKLQIVKDKISKNVSKSLANKYKQELTNYGLCGEIYFLYFKNLNLIKIGSTSSRQSRFNNLYKDFGEFDIIQILQTENRFGFEKSFHDLFSDFSNPLLKGCGKTEFYSIDIIESPIFRSFTCFQPSEVFTL